MASSEEFINKDKLRKLWRRHLLSARDYFFQWSKKTDSEDVHCCEALLTEIREKKSEYEKLVNEMCILLDYDDTDDKKVLDELLKDLADITFGVISLSSKIIAYLKTTGALNPRESIASVNDSTIVSPTSEIRLPKIQIPTFDGDPRKFLKFKSLFSNLIHDDTSIPNIRKLYYLQQALQGSAEEFIRDVEMNETSYNLVWTELLNRYENKRVIIRTHLADIFDLKKIKDESGIRSLLDSVISSIRGLKGCGEEPSQWGTILSYLVSTKLDDATKRDFENSIEDKSSYPSFKTLTEFLEVRASAVEDRELLNSFDKQKKPWS